MSDRHQDSTITLYADLPSTGLTGTVTLTDALGNSAATATNYSEVGNKRYACTLTVTTSDVVEGLWKAVWSYSSTSFTQEFTVGGDEGSTKWATRFQSARRVGDVWLGYIGTATTNTFTDTSVLGSADEYVGSWFVLDETNNQGGSFKRITEYDGSTFTFDSAYAIAPGAGERYLLLDPQLRPDRIDTALEATIDSLRSRCFIPVQATGLSTDGDGYLAIPNGWSHVTQVTNLDSDNIEHTLNPADWLCVPGQRVYIPGFDPTWTLTMTGMRQARKPLFEDSEVDIPLSVLSPEVARILHLDLARGQATDFDAHFQRASAAFQEHGVQLTIALPRIQRDAKRVIH